MDEAILRELQAINQKLDRLDSIDNRLGIVEKAVKKTQKDIGDIKDYLRVGIDEDYKRLRDRVSALEKKVM